MYKRWFVPWPTSTAHSIISIRFARIRKLGIEKNDTSEGSGESGANDLLAWLQIHAVSSRQT